MTLKQDENHVICTVSLMIEFPQKLIYLCSSHESLALFTTPLMVIMSRHYVPYTSDDIGLSPETASGAECPV